MSCTVGLCHSKSIRVLLLIPFATCGWHCGRGAAYLSAVRHEAVHQRVAVVEQSVQLPGRLHWNRSVRAELLPLDGHGAAAGRRHALHLVRHLNV